jgi:uncharacterized protein (TIGR00255 family)
MSGVIRSMTGFARVRKSTESGEVTVGVKSLNHRALDIHFHTSATVDPHENALRSLIKTKLTRGHIDVRISLAPAGAAAASAVNQELLAAYVASFRQAAAALGISAEPDLNQALRLPGMFGEAGNDGDAWPDLEPLLLEALADAIAELNRFREREGSDMAAVIRKHNTTITECAAEIEAIRERAVPAYQARLNEKLKELLKGVGVEPQRIAQEAAILADRSDIGEECARLKIHAAQLQQLVEGGGEVGKKLDFLLQEMNRETNTILSKTTGIGEAGLRITDLALKAKAEIEKIREQAQNLE